MFIALTTHLSGTKIRIRLGCIGGYFRHELDGFTVVFAKRGGAWHVFENPEEIDRLIVGARQ